MFKGNIPRIRFLQGAKLSRALLPAYHLWYSSKHLADLEWKEDTELEKSLNQSCRKFVCMRVIPISFRVAYANAPRWSVQRTVSETAVAAIPFLDGQSNCEQWQFKDQFL